MTMFEQDTIVAIASAAGGAERGILRISGPHTVALLGRCFRADGEDWHATSEARSWPGRLVLPLPFGEVPCRLYLWPHARSYTREPCAELHLPGAIPLVQAALQAVCAAGARLAQPGEFTLRAFLAGRIDLTQAEAVLGVIDARSGHELHVALRQMSGGLARPLHALREQLLELLAHLEAGLDFVDEDIEFISAAELRASLEQVLAQLRQLQSRLRESTVERQPPRLVLRGAPNVGKSSLFNTLVGREAAIVADHHGTTRDYLSAVVELAGVELELIDTAGLDTQVALDSPALGAQQVSAEQLASAHVELLCLDSSRPLNADELAWLSQEARGPRLIIWTKADLHPEWNEDGARPAGRHVSVVTGAGLEPLRSEIAELVQSEGVVPEDVLPATSARCRESIEEGMQCLQRALDGVEVGQQDELVAVELREALHALGRIVGTVYTDDILDRIFSRFCIGK